MTRPVLTTRFIGYTQHASRDVLAPQDLVYEVSEPPARKPLTVLAGILCGAMFTAGLFELVAPTLLPSWAAFGLLIIGAVGYYLSFGGRRRRAAARAADCSAR